MLHLVEHGIEYDLLRPGFDDLLDFFGTPGGAAPDRNFGTQIGIFVAAAEPLAYAPLAARFVAIDRQVDAFREMKRRWVAFGSREHIANPRRLTGKRSGR